MIGYLTGIFIDTTDQYILLDVNGVGYAIYVPETWRGKAKTNNQYALHIVTHVRDDAIELYGFATAPEKRLFELMLSVSGIGPKTALSIVSYGVSEVQSAVRTADVEFFTAIPRIGKKNAQKIIIELKNKLGGIAELDLKETDAGIRHELLEALQGMGFSRSEIQQFLRENVKDDQTLEQNLKQALQFLGKRRS